MKQKNKVIVVISLLFTLISCTSISKNEKVGAVNSASKYCLKKSGKFEIRKTYAGSEYGVCKYKNENEVEEWEYFRNNNKK